MLFTFASLALSLNRGPRLAAAATAGGARAGFARGLRRTFCLFDFGVVDWVALRRRKGKGGVERVNKDAG